MAHTTSTTISTITRNTTAEELVKIYNTDLSGKVVIVTGSNSGIGLGTARVLSSVGAKVIIPCRTVDKAHIAIEEIKEDVSQADLVPMQLDLSDTKSIKAFARAFIDLELPLDILICNAGIMAVPLSYTKDGFESQFGVNHLGHFLLVNLLTPKLKANAPSRIVIVSSSGNAQLISKDGIDFDNLNAEKSYNQFASYGQSKLANVLHSKELQRRFDAEGVDVTVTALHPGVVVSNIARNYSFRSFWDLIRVMRWSKMECAPYKSISLGASTSVFCAVSPDVNKGEFYSDNAIDRRFLNEQADNEEMAKRLWDISEQLLADR